MSGFTAGFCSSLLATFVGYLLAKIAWPAFLDKAMYRGVRVDGTWEIIEERHGEQQRVGKLTLEQTGRNISGESIRSKTRGGEESNRKFSYRGSIHGHQATLLFGDKKGVGFDVGSYIFVVQNDGNTMVGMTTFHGRVENRIVSESRTLKKVVG